MSAQPRGLGQLAQRAVDLLREDTRKLSPMSRGVAVSGVVLTAAATTTVHHTLGRVPVGYVVTAASVGAPGFYESSARTRETLTLTATSTSTVDLWVY